MIDENVLEQLLAEIADEIEVPADGAERVVHAVSHSAKPARRPSPQITRVLLVAAACAVLVGVGVSINNATHGTPSSVAGGALRVHGPATATTVAGGIGAQGGTGLAGGPGLIANDGARVSRGLPVGNYGAQGPIGATGPAGVSPQVGDQGIVGPQGPSGPVGFAGPTGPAGVNGPVGPTGLMAGAGALASSGGIQDGAKIVKSGALDLTVPHGRLRVAVSRVSGVATGYGGYMANTQTKYGGDDATAQITMRIPVANFEAAIKQLTHLPEVTVLSQSTTGADVTDQYVNVQAQMISLSSERDSFLALLSASRNVDEILMLHDRVAGVQSQLDQLQGRLNLLDHQSSLSSLAITISENPATAAKSAAHVVPPPTGLSKSWKDARQGFANVVEWLLARSGGALIALIAALALLFGLRYLYPVVRRGLL
jgi:hypothetical protein